MVTCKTPLVGDMVRFEQKKMTTLELMGPIKAQFKGKEKSFLQVGEGKDEKYYW